MAESDTGNDVNQVENKITSQQKRSEQSAVSRLANELGRRDHVTGEW